MSPAYYDTPYGTFSVDELMQEMDRASWLSMDLAEVCRAAEVLLAKRDKAAAKELEYRLQADGIYRTAAAEAACESPGRRGESASMTSKLNDDDLDEIVQVICENCDDESGEQMFKALNAIGPRNNATMTMHCAQIMAGQLADMEEGDIRDEYWAAFGRLVLLCMKTPEPEDTT